MEKRLKVMRNYEKAVMKLFDPIRSEIVKESLIDKECENLNSIPDML
jgi:hypothetical protein